MDEPFVSQFDDPEFIKKLFYQYFTQGPFHLLGQILEHIMGYLDMIDIPKEDIIKAFDIMIEERKYENDRAGALNYFLMSFKVDGIPETRRMAFIRLLWDHFSEHKEDMVKQDWADIIKILTYQMRFLEMQSKDSELLGVLDLTIGKMNGYYSVSPELEEGVMREYIEEFQTNFFKYLPDEEATDYAAQIILSLRP